MAQAGLIIFFASLSITELLRGDDKKVIVTRVFSELLFLLSHPSIAVKTAVLMLWFMEHTEDN